MQELVLRDCNCKHGIVEYALLYDETRHKRIPVLTATFGNDPLLVLRIYVNTVRYQVCIIQDAVLHFFKFIIGLAPQVGCAFFIKLIMYKLSHKFCV